MNIKHRFQIENILFIIEDDIAILKKADDLNTDNMNYSKRKMVIPDILTIKGTEYKVEKILESAINIPVAGRVRLIVIPDTIKEIEKNAIQGSALSLVLPNSIEKMGKNAISIKTDKLVANIILETGMNFRNKSGIDENALGGGLSKLVTEYDNMNIDKKFIDGEGYAFIEPGVSVTFKVIFMDLYETAYENKLGNNDFYSRIRILDYGPNTKKDNIFELYSLDFELRSAADLSLSIDENVDTIRLSNKMSSINLDIKGDDTNDFVVKLPEGETMFGNLKSLNKVIRVDNPYFSGSTVKERFLINTSNGLEKELVDLYKANAQTMGTITKDDTGKWEYNANVKDYPY